jgi:RNA polymerase sigma-70 factor, ECF subfamily
MTYSHSALLKEEFTRAHALYKKALKARAFYKIQDPARCDDLVQTTFMKTWLYLMRGGKIEMMEAFLFHVLNGLIIDEYRKKKTVSLDTLLEDGFEPSVQETERHINILDGQSALSLIERLPHKYKEILRLRYVEDLSLSEMSRLTGESRNTLAVQIHRGLLKLRNLYTRKLSSV